MFQNTSGKEVVSPLSHRSYPTNGTIREKLIFKITIIAKYARRDLCAIMYCIFGWGKNCAVLHTRSECDCALLCVMMCCVVVSVCECAGLCVSVCGIVCECVGLFV